MSKGVWWERRNGDERLTERRWNRKLVRIVRHSIFQFHISFVVGRLNFFLWTPFDFYLETWYRNRKAAAIQFERHHRPKRHIKLRWLLWCYFFSSSIPTFGDDLWHVDVDRQFLQNDCVIARRDQWKKAMERTARHSATYHNSNIDV